MREGAVCGRRVVLRLAIAGLLGVVCVLPAACAHSPEARTVPPSPVSHPSWESSRSPQADSPRNAGGSLLGASLGGPVASLPRPVASLVASEAGPRITSPRSLKVPILMYHVVDTKPSGASNPDLYVSPREFVAQLRYLQANGYEAVTLQEVYNFWEGKGSLPQRPVVLSFDDGNESAFTVVAPLLNSIGWPGVLNLVVDGKDGAPRMPLPEVRALIACGWEIDSHTLGHVDVTKLSDAELTRQLTGSKEALERMLGMPVNFFCYPFGAYDQRTADAVRAAGYLAATTTRPGLAEPDELFTLHRVRVSGGESMKTFAAMVQGR